MNICENPDCKANFTPKRNTSGKYCSRSCAATVNNKKAKKRSLEGSCHECGVPISSSRMYCKGHKYLAYDRSNKNMGNNPIRNFEPQPEKERACIWCGSSDGLIPGFKTCEECRRPYKCLLDGCENQVQKRQKTKASTYCSRECSNKDRANDKIKAWLSGEWTGGKGSAGDVLSETVRKYLLEQAKYACEVCGFNTPHPVDGSSILEIDHIDGNPENHRPENLKVLCPNHHALTPTYRARNTGNGRKLRYKKVDEPDVDDVA